MSKRTRILVDPPVQWAIARRVLCHWSMLFVCLVTISVMVRMLMSAGDLPFTESMAVAVKSQASLLCIMVILVPVFLRDTLKLSNRFAGPMYRLRSVLGEMSKGEKGYPIKFRKGDFWQEVAGDFNVVYDELQTLKQENAELKAQLEANSVVEANS